MERKFLPYVIAVGLLLMFLSIHLQGWLIYYFFGFLPYGHMSAPSLMLALSLTVLMPTFLVLFPLGWVYWKRSAAIKGLAVGLACVLSFATYRLYHGMEYVVPVIEGFEHILQIVAAALFARAGAAARAAWTRGRDSMSRPPIQDFRP
jgi:hypothetical protein